MTGRSRRQEGRQVIAVLLQRLPVLAACRVSETGRPRRERGQDGRHQGGVLLCLAAEALTDEDDETDQLLIAVY